MGNISSTNTQNPPKYNFKSIEIQETIKEQIKKELSVYHDICNYHNREFPRLEHYFTHLTYEDISSSYIDYVNLAIQQDKIIMSVFVNNYLDPYKSYMYKKLKETKN